MKTPLVPTSRRAVFRASVASVLATTLVLLSAATPQALVRAAAAPSDTAASPIEQRTRGLVHGAGFVPFWWDARGGKLLLEVPAFDSDVLYYVSAASGGGSVELPLDRGILSSQVVHFRREGSRVLVVQQNLEFRALGAGAARAANVAASFPVSVLASLPVEAEAGGRVVVDGSALFLRDAGGIVSDLRRANQAGYRFDAARTSFLPASMKAFPDNTEIETLATFASDAPGVVTTGVTPDASALSLRIHHSFLRAPTGYTPRRADPRIGVSTIDFRDHGQPVDNGLEVEWITRWRLEKKDPSAAMSEPVKPIVFYLDPAIPEPYRSAMKAGTLWWNEAFEAAGFRNAVQVADPTPDMDPMDIRYAWVLWIDRDERGFSSGGTYRDPRTGEILGSKTRMDSHRIRTIANYWEAYMPASVRPDGATPEALTRLTMLRQSLLVAHELGHALGFSHNFASSLNDRASVMEYPSPRLRVEGGRLDLSQAFQDRIGEYDKYMARYAYSVLPAASERSALDGLIAEMRGRGILFVPSTDPRWTWYDDRATPMEYLTETAAARRILLAQYGQDVLKPGEPVGALRDLRLWMVYLHQRWAIESGVGYVGGQFHEFAVRGDGVKPTQLVPGATQREVLRLLLDVVEPANLAMPDVLLEQLTPHPGTNLEDLASDYAFDHLRAARILSALVLEPLLAPERAARLVAFSDRDATVPSLPEVVDAIVARTWGATDKDRRAAALRRVTQRVALDALMMLGASASATPDVRSYVLDRLARLGAEIGARKAADPMAGAHLRQAARDIEAYLADPAARAPKSASPAWGKRPRSRYPSPPGPPL